MLRFPPRRILVAVEFSKASQFAWEAAQEIAGRFCATLEAVWCIEPVAAEMTALRGLSRKSGYRAEGLRRLRARLGPGVRLHAVNGDPARTLRRLARERFYDLIVVGTHRRSDLMHWVDGSVAEAVVRAAPCPVLVVPRAWRTPRRVLAPVTAAAYAHLGLQAAAVVARAYKGRLAMLEAVSKPELGPAATKRMGLQFERLAAPLRLLVRPELDVRVGKPVEMILRGGRFSDLTVLVAHRKSLLGDTVLGTTVERVLRHCRHPVLAIPSP